MDFFSKLQQTDTLEDITNILFSSTHEGLMISDEQCIILEINPAFCLITGYNRDEIIGGKTTILQSHRHDKKFYSALWGKLNKEGKWNGSIWDRRKNGEIFLMELTIIEVKIKNSPNRLFVGLFIDLSSTKLTPLKKTNHDPLTNLPNRLLLRDHLGFILAHARRNNLIVALLFLDLDRFKKMNDSLGYHAGDIILVNTAERIKKNLREADTVFRLGNDEFAVILQGITRIEDVGKVAKKILHTFTTPYNIPHCKTELYITASIGISLFPQDGTTYGELIKNAEAAMYNAKELEHNMHRALEQKEFIVYYQPIVDVNSMMISGAEALVRWRHPELGLISPAQFIPLAEETGLIAPIDEYVMKAACHQTQVWHEKGFEDLCISINVSARQFQQPDLVKKIGKIITQSSLPPYNVELEITESTGMKNPERSFTILGQLKEMGINISIDDFGTGYSSLSYLKKFPIDILKIDQSFIKDIGVNRDNDAIVCLIISMGHTLKLRVIAEGVETEKQLAFLQNNHCDLFQGYLFSKPVPAPDFEKLLEKNRENFIPDKP
jgi:diguanylate cyclase (GGDEF)-like protein/PAS domain S-box-containing protein